MACITSDLNPQLLSLGAPSARALSVRVRNLQRAIEQRPWPVALPQPGGQEPHFPLRLSIDYLGPHDLTRKLGLILDALGREDSDGVWKLLRAQGVSLGRGPAGKVAFVFPGQGAQYAHMLQELRRDEPLVDETLGEADRALLPVLGSKLSDLIEEGGQSFTNTAVVHGAVLAADVALLRLLAARGITPDLLLGHSLGEYAALVAAGCLSFEDALDVVCHRGLAGPGPAPSEPGRMAAVFAGAEDVEAVLSRVDGFVQVANINSRRQVVIGGATPAVDASVERLVEAGYDARIIPVSEAFHTPLVEARASAVRRTLSEMRLCAPHVPLVSNLTGELYPSGPDATAQIPGLVGDQVRSTVLFAAGLHTLYAQGARVVVEVGPKKALTGFVEEELGHHGDVVTTYTCHPKVGERVSLNRALGCILASGVRPAQAARAA